MITVQEAQTLIRANRPERKIMYASLRDGLGRVLAHSVKAKVSRPDLPVSAMDGYAVRLCDVSEPGAVLNVIGEAPAGQPYSGCLGPDQAVRIFTGGVLPENADHIVIQEDTDRDGEFVTCNLGYSGVRHVRRAGLDFEREDTILQVGSIISPYALAMAAAANHAELPIWQPLNVVIISNGNELREPGSDLLPGQTVNSNKYCIEGLVREWGALPVDIKTASDSRDVIQNVLSSTPKNTDVFVTIGGASVGEHDHMRQAFIEAGFEMIFEKVAVRPGKPTWFARRGKQCVLGLPGNPASSFVCAHVFLKPLLSMGSKEDFIAAQLRSPLPANGSREAYLRGKASISDNGNVEVDVISDQDSSLISPFLTGNCLIQRTADEPPVSAGTRVKILLLRAL